MMPNVLFTGSCVAMWLHVLLLISFVHLQKFYSHKSDSIANICGSAVVIPSVVVAASVVVASVVVASVVVASVVVASVVVASVVVDSVRIDAVTRAWGVGVGVGITTSVVLGGNIITVVMVAVGSTVEVTSGGGCPVVGGWISVVTPSVVT